MLINLTNHPSSLWSQKQKETASREYGEIIDVPFPTVSPEASEADVSRLVDEYLVKIRMTGGKNELTVHVMGEMTFTVLMVRRLQEKGITCIASTTERKVIELADGKRLTQFDFVRFRRYNN